MRQWDAVDLQHDKETWREESQRTASAALDAATLQEMMLRSIAESEAWREQVQTTVDAVDIAAEKARNRRDFNLHSTMTALDELVTRQRESAAEARQAQLTGLADGVEKLIDRPLPASLAKATGAKA